LLSVRSLLGAVAVTPPKKKKIAFSRNFEPAVANLASDAVATPLKDLYGLKYSLTLPSNQSLIPQHALKTEAFNKNDGTHVC
jgi:histidinol phosphatase-like enzyme